MKNKFKLVKALNNKLFQLVCMANKDNIKFLDNIKQQ